MIRVLPPEEARRIAAGEVIDRPAAQVREFLDNAIDSGARLIELILEEGGIRLTEVVDDGCGMGKDDLELCWHTHATSKIRCLDDLKSAETLGFRGEALAATAAVSRLEILSSRDGREAWKLSVGPGERNAPVLEQGRRTKGTSVRAIGLYDTIPARKRFLKRPGSEAVSCRQIFNEKALAFPGIAFRFTLDGVLKIFLPPVSSYRERFRQIFLEEREGAFLHEIAANGKSFSVSVVAGGPELLRGDRRLQFVFANNRRIQDFALLQALEYGLQGWFPNATHPVGAVFVDIDPALADFNIHPAKREARFLDPGAIHHTVSSALGDFCRAKLLQDTSRVSGPREDALSARLFSGDSLDRASSFAPRAADSTRFQPAEFGAGKSPSSQLAMEALLSNPPDFAPLPGRSTDFAAEDAAPYLPTGSARYLGRLFELFILVEKGEGLFIVDQHAAHERIIYERFIQGPVPRQELLVAIPFSTESTGDDSFLEKKRDELEKLGIVIRKSNDEWLIEALPSLWKLSDQETVAEILSLKNAGENLAERWATTLSCRAAVKDGDFLDERTALALAEEAFSLPARRCPHGRPIWFELSRQDLLKAVKRV